MQQCAGDTPTNMRGPRCRPYGVFFLLACLFMLGKPAFGYPVGTVFPKGVIAGARTNAGIDAGTDPGSCCWLRKTASIAIAVPAHVDQLILKILIPDYALQPNQRQRIEARIDEGPSYARCCLKPGFHELKFPIKPAGSASTHKLFLRMSETFVPAQVGRGDELQPLSLLLREIDFEMSGFTAAQFSFFSIVLLVVFAAAYWRPMFALVSIVLTAPFTQSITMGAVTLTLQQIALIGAATALCLRSRMGIPRPKPSAQRFLIAVAGLIAVMISSTMLAQFKEPAILELWKALQYLVTFYVAYTAFKMDPRVSYVTIALSVVTLLVCASALNEEFTGAQTSMLVFGHVFPRIAGILEGPNQLGAFLGIAVPVLASYGFCARPRYVEMVAALAGLVVGILTFSRGTLLGIAVAAIVVIALKYRAQWQSKVLLGLGGAFALLFIVALLQFAQAGPRTLDTQVFGASNGDFQGGLGSRAILWHGAEQLWRQSPLLGIGPGNFELRVSEVGAIGVRTHANSIYFQYLAETGILGFLCLLLITALPIREFALKSESALGLGLLASSIGLAFHQIVDYLTFYPKVGVLWWALLGAGFAIVHYRRRAPH